MRIFSYFAIFLFVTALYGEINYEAARLERRLKAVRTAERVTVDGRLDEPAWSQAPVAAGFIQNDPRPDDPASEKTEVRVLYDNENLYIGVYAYDSETGRLIISDLSKDFNKDSGDSLDIVLDTFRDERNGYVFATNPAGAKWDAQMANEGRETNDNWDGVWHVQSRIVADGWIAEIAIPFRTLKFREQDVQTWGINFQRKIRRKNEDSYWSPLPRIYSVERVSLAGTLEDLEGVKPGANVRVKPYVVGSFGQFSDGDKDYTGDIGIDAKYGLTTGLTWDFTYNTDFSQVEADEQQINLTRFSLFFPEKREFFLENSGIFQFGATDRFMPTGGGGVAGGAGGPRQSGNDLILFFSRQIGLSQDGEAIPILGGTRLTGRVGTYELGLLNIQQRESGDINATNFTVARLRRNILSTSDIGVMLVNKEVQDSPHYNRVLGADANFRFGQAVMANAYLVKSFTPAGADKDLAGRVGFNYKDNIWDLRASYISIQEDFVNEMGFASRLGIGKFAGYLGRQVRPQSVQKVIRQFNPHVHLDYIVDPDGNLDTRQADYHFMAGLQDSSFLEGGANTTLERFTQPFVINRNRKITIPPGVYRYNEYFVTGRSNNGRPISGNIRWSVGEFYTGYRHSYTVGGIFRFSHKLNTSFSYTHNNINLPEGHFKTNLLTTRFNYSFSTTMFLNALVQYNNDTRQWSSNVRFNLIHRPLSDVFLVYNERRNSEGGDLIDRAVIAKITYMIAR